MLSGTHGLKRWSLKTHFSFPMAMLIILSIVLLVVPAHAENGDRIPHSNRETAPKVGADIRQQIELVVRDTQKGKSPAEIASRYHMDAALAEQIARLYVTHPGVTVDGIMTKMGL